MLKISAEAEGVIKTLNESGFEAYCVGGAVRDLLMDLTPTDYDIATDATPDQVSKIFPNTFATGIKHGTVTVLHRDVPIEVTTYRSEGLYTDGRHPENVEFVKTIDDDLKRRDFTVNAIAYSPVSGLFDPLGGQDDIKGRIIRCVGDARERFNEDKLRVLRCFRFAAKLGFKIEDMTLCAALEYLRQLESISRERVFSELSLLICTPFLEKALPVFSSGHLEFLGLGKASDRFLKLSLLPCDSCVRLTALCIISGSKSSDVAFRLKTSKQFRTRLENICRLTHEDIGSDYAIRMTVSRFGWDALLSALEIRRHILSENITPILQTIKRIGKDGFPKSVRELKISGKQLMAMGAEGSQIGIILDRLFDLTLHDPTLNDTERLLQIAEDSIKKYHKH